MSNLVKAVKQEKQWESKRVNFMGGISYTINPLDTMKMVTASSIFGEPQYYRNGEFAEKYVKDGEYHVHDLMQEYSVLPAEYDKRKTSDIMESAIDTALSYDFAAVLDWAVELRTGFLMRLNPQIIMVRAAIHPDRSAYTEAHPGEFDRINQIVMSRADESASQLAYYLYKNKQKKQVPGILKKSWAKKLSGLSAEQVNKYKNTGIGMIDTVRVCHANSSAIDELMRTGTVKVEETKATWETLRAAGKTWEEILLTINMGHMARLRNLRGIFTEIDNLELCQEQMELLKKGVKSGKQFPFRYYTAKKMIEAADKIHHKQLILDTLEECMDLARENMPKLPGRTICLSDNSGSAWGSFTSEYGKVTIADIGNLSSIVTAANSDEGFVGVFGDRLTICPVSKREGVLKQAREVGAVGNKVGMSTENGIWLFFKDAIEQRGHWDNIVIYSDMQAGHGGLYGIGDAYVKAGYGWKGHYIDVAKLIAKYREINPKVNVTCVQTAGYDNILVPEYGYRTNFAYGWTGKELLFLDTMRKFWDEKDAEASN